MQSPETYNRKATVAAWVIIAGAAAGLAWSLASGANGHEELPPLGIKLLAPPSLLSDSPAALRVILTDHAKRQPAAGAMVTVRLTNAAATAGYALFQGRTDQAGTVEARFRLPAVAAGRYVLRVEAVQGQNRDELAQEIEVRKAYQVLLATDKPVYQPSQTIHLRALALRRPDLRPVAGELLTFEVRDPKGNKVFKRQVKTSAWGVAWADFVLADEINLGRYEAKASLGDAEATKTVTVDRYVLPKFKVTVETDRPFYLPGQRLAGKVSAQYFFGKPVANGQVKVVAKTFDVAYRELAEVTGTTAQDGTFAFTLDLPRHFVGQPFEQGKAFVQLDVKVTDQAEHAEKITVSRPVAGQELELHAVPESGELVPNLPNRIWVLVSDPTGKPVQARVRLAGATAQPPWQVEWQPQTVITDALGIAELTLTLRLAGEARGAGEPGLPLAPRPAAARKVAPLLVEQAEGGPGTEAGRAVTVHLQARALSGALAEQTLALPAGEGVDGESLLLRLDKAVAKVGEVVNAVVLAAARTGYVYLDVVKDRQTMLTKAAELRAGKASVQLVLEPHLAGTTYLSAYRITRRGNVVRDTQPLLVAPASDLQVQVRADKEVYRPGEPVRLQFEVRSARNEPRVAALGVSVVDESVFALQEMQPGMERVYAYLEKELQKPRYEIHGLELPTVIAQRRPLLEPAQQRAARVTLASAPLPALDFTVKDSYAVRLERAKEKWAQKLQPKVNVVWRALNAYARKHGRPPLVQGAVQALLAEGFLRPADLEDLWGTRMSLAPCSPGQDRLWDFVLVSAGPDRQMDTEDDLVIAPGREGAGFGFPRILGVPVLRGPVEAAGGPPAPMRGPLLKEEAAARGQGPAQPAPGPQPPRVRQFFPETAFFKPDLITDAQGRAAVQFPMPDSITTWRLTALANSAQGELGSRDAPLRCFQDFFVDLDLPVALTQGDEISLPVAVYNYLKDRQTIRLKLVQEPWLALAGEAEQTLELGPSEVAVRYFRLRARELGQHQLTVYAYGSRLSDAIKRTVSVLPDGQLQAISVGGRLSHAVSATLEIPPQAISGASTILIKLYPGIFSQAVEGLDSILQMPFGCFEQTSSVTYPNVLVLDYMRTTRQLTPEIQMKAEGFINQGYQRLLSFEVPGGGFSWFGEAPANQLLTALGLMEFHDMAQVYPIDEAVLARTRQWLLSKQTPEGAWEPDKAFLHPETWGRLQNSKLLPTAYITWALASTGDDSPGTKSGYEYVRAHWQAADDPYQLAVVCNALVSGDQVFNRGDLNAATAEALDKLLSLAQRAEDKMWWESKIVGVTHSSGRAADLEATGLAALALINSGLHGAEASQVLNFLIAAKDPQGTWHSTQATVLALKALLLAQKGGTQKASGSVTVEVNGRQAATLEITPDSADVLRLVDCRPFVRPGTNLIKLTFAGQGSLLYQAVGQYWLPWQTLPRPAQQLLDIAVDYDRTQLAVNDIVTATVRIKNKAAGRTSMVVVDLGVPPGFTVEAGDLAELVDQQVINKFNLTGRQIIVYLEEIPPQHTVTFSYRLRARYPLRAKAPASTAYEYYNPDNRAQAAPTEIVVGQ
jgi:hypothetical protein